MYRYSDSPSSSSTTTPFWYRCLAYCSLLATASSLLTIGIAHLNYPGFTETMEGDILQHIERASRGEAIYPAPQADYVPLTYMPLYHYLAAPLYRFFGDSFFGPRLVSLLATFISGFWIWRIVLKQTGSYSTAALGLSLFCGSYRVMDAALFTVHPDAMLLCFLLSGYWFWAYGTTKRDDLLWLGFFTLAFWTKQHGALFFGWAVLYALLFRKNALPRWAILLGMFLGGPVSYGVIGNFMGERFWFHTLLQPTHWEQSWWLSIRRLIYVLCVLAPLSMVVFLDYWRGIRDDFRWRPTPLVWFLLTGILTSLYTMRIAGASNNHYAPLHALLSVSFAVVCFRILVAKESPRLHWLLLLMTIASAGVVWMSLRMGGSHPIPQYVPILLGVGTLALFILFMVKPKRYPEWEVFILLVVQFGVLAYSPWNYFPRAGFETQRSDFQRELSELDAPVIWVDYGNIPADLTGQKILKMPCWVALEDLDRQQIPRETIEKELQPWRERIESMDRLYLLSFDRLEKVTIWNRFAGDFEEVKDYGDRFGSIRQIAEHWFGAGDAPRYLYRKKPKATK